MTGVSKSKRSVATLVQSQDETSWAQAMRWLGKGSLFAWSS